MSNRNYSTKDITGAWDLIQRSRAITLLSHSNPDADGVSACATLEHIFKKFDKSVETIYPSKPETDYKRQPRNTLINKHTQQPDLIIVIDTATPQRMYWSPSFNQIPMINIDHHISNIIKGIFNFINPQSSSACEELYFLLKQWSPGSIDAYIAQCLLCGILYDTKIFHTQSTTANTLRIAAELTDYGINLFELESELLSNKNPSIIALWGKLLSNISFSNKKNAAWITVTQSDLQQFKLTPFATVGLSNFLCELSDIDITIVFYETEDGKTKVSLRSRKTDVNKFAAQFGGGGHPNAAGILSNKPVKQTVDEITQRL